MKVTTNKLSDTKVEIKVILDAEDLKDARQKAVARLASEMKIQGFRKGKAPLKVAEKQMATNDINSTALDIAIRSTVPQAFEQSKKAPLVIPNVNVTKYIPDETVEYTATAEILPEIKLGDYKKLKAKKQEVKVSDKDIQDVLDQIASAYAEKSPVKRPAKLTDEVTIDFEGKKDGVAFDGGAAKDYKIVLGSGQFIPGFEDGIVGHEAGDRFDLDLTFPKDYHSKELAGQKTTFNVLLKQVTEIKAPKQDDEFAKKSSPFKTMKELKDDIKKSLESQNQHKADDKYKDDLVRELVEKSTVSAPEIMIKDQLNFIKEDISRNAAAQGLTFEDYLKQTGQTEKDWEKEASKIAELRVKSSLCLQILARDENITVPDEEVEAKLSELRDVYQISPEALKGLKDPNVRQDIKNRLTIEKTLNHLVDLNSK
ncbi:trigger factor [Candidatus Saccharibacteria bacterium]|nr:trigger factor [Candidatus Saccharibacteria bacterium]